MRGFVGELRPERGCPAQPVLGLIAAHRQQGDHELAGVLVGHPGQFLIDDGFDRRSGAIEVAPDPIHLGEAEAPLRLFHHQEILLDGGNASGERGQHGAFVLAYRGLDRVEALRYLCAGGLESGDRFLVRVGDEIPNPHPHGRESGLESFACVGQVGRVLGAAEGAGDIGLTGRERNAIGQKADQRNDRDRDDAAANRGLRVEKLEGKNARHRKWHGTSCAGGHRMAVNDGSGPATGFPGR